MQAISPCTRVSGSVVEQEWKARDMSVPISKGHPHPKKCHGNQPIHLAANTSIAHDGIESGTAEAAGAEYVSFIPFSVGCNDATMQREREH
jgi:hypothetical protein